MKKILSLALAGVMLIGSALPVFADDAVVPAGLTLAEGSRLVLDSATGYVDKIDGTITVGDLKANFANEITIAGKSDDDFVATDDVIGDYKALIYGDVNRDGKVNLSDVSVVLQKIAGWSVNVNADAADVNKTGDVNLTDVTKLLKKIAGWADISLGNVRWVFENAKLPAEKDDADLDLYFASNLIKVAQSNNTHTGNFSYKVKLARNETESCQFYVSSKKDVEGMTVELSEFEHEYGEGTLSAEILIHQYLEMTVFTNTLNETTAEHIEERDYFVDPLLPLADSFEVRADMNQGFTINVTAGKDAPAGMYKAVLTVKDAEGKVVETAPVYTYVWDFTLPDTPYSKSSFGMSGQSIYGTLGGWYDRKWYTGDDGKTHEEHYEFLLEHNISAYQMPHRANDPRADKYMSDPRVTSFEICGENLRLPEEDNWDVTMACWNKVQSNPVWAEKGHFYYVDEPYMTGSSLIKHQYEYLTEKLGADADFDIIVPFFNSDVDPAQYMDMLEFIQPYVDIFVPRSDGFHANTAGVVYGRSPWTSRGIVAKRGENLDRIMKLKEDPEKELWWYVCIDPGFPYPNLFSFQQGNMSRVLWWQQFIFDTKGFLYWATQADWDTFIRGKCKSMPGVGDGLLMYVGAMFGREENIPITSFRLVQIRDGFDDFDYLKMAEELVGREVVMDVVTKLTTDVLKVNEDPAVMMACRDAIAELIISAAAE